MVNILNIISKYRNMKQLILVAILYFIMISANAQTGCWKMVSAGLYYSVAIKADSTLWAWGNNSYGQLGDSTSTSKIIPTQIGTGNNWQIVCAGSEHTVALKTDGTLWAWGNNSSGQLGDSTTVDKIIPTQIGTATNWKTISAGPFYTVAIKTDGTLWAWGGSPSGNTIAPLQIGTDNNWMVVSAGYAHILALKNDGTLWALGDNSTGELGDDTIIYTTTTPKQIGTASNWKTVSAGYFYSEATKTDGTLWAWGQNKSGKLGSGGAAYIDIYFPEQIGTDTNWLTVSANVTGNHTIGIKNDGTLWSWGDNTYGQVGDSTNTQRNIPVKIAANSRWSSVAVGANCNLAIDINNVLSAWGDNSNNQLGDATSTNRYLPESIPCTYVCPPTIINNIILNGCDTLTYNGVTYTSSAAFTDTFKSVLGCDSLHNIVAITINQTPKKDTFVTACNYFYWNGVYYTKDTVVTVHKPNYVNNSIYNGFDNGMTAPTGWFYNSHVHAYTGAGAIPPPNTPYGASPPSLIIDSANVLITSPIVNGIITSIKFWFRGFGPGTNCINIDGYDGSTWSPIGNFCGGAWTPGQVFNYSDTSAPGTTKYYLPYGKKFNQIRFETGNSVGFYDVFELDDVTINYKTTVGCDTQETLHLKVLKPSTRTINISGCNIVSYKGKLYTSSTSFVDTLRYLNGCDSLYTTNNITIYKQTPTTNTTTLSGCGSVTYKSVVYTTSTIVSDTVRSSNGCDSIYNIANITVSSLLLRDTIATSCGGINWYGNNYTKDTIATHQKTNFFNLTVNEGFNAGSTAPTGWTFTTLSGTYTSAGNYGLASPSLKFGKTGDQIITAVLPYAATQLSFWLKNQGSSGSTLVVEGYNGTKWVKVDTISYFPTTGTTSLYNATSTPALPAGLKQFRFTYTKSTGNISLDDVSMLYSTGSGCDSLITLHFSIKKATTNSINLSGCKVIYKGITYNNSTVIKDTVKSLLGCDSLYNVANITITKITPTTTSLNLNSCDSIVYRGKVYKSSINFIDTLKSAGGCDSVYTSVNVAISNSISGGIYHPLKGYTIPEVSLIVNGINSLNPVTGSYGIHCIAAASNETIKLYKNNDINKANGITTLDIALTQSHILGKSLLNSPYKIIAADVNGDGKVSTLDIVYMKRVILGIDTTFTNSNSKQTRLWAFADSSYVFLDNSNPFPFKDSISFAGLNANKTNQTFIGCKLGDVNWDWNPALAKPGVSDMNAVELYYSSDDERKSSEEVRIPIRVKNFKDLLGLQYTINFNAEALKYIGINNNVLNVETGTNHAAEGKISFLWVDAKSEQKTLEDGTVLFELVFERTGKETIGKEAIVNTLSVDGSVTAVAAYDKYYGVHDVVLKKVESIQTLQPESWVVAPNPTKDGVIQVQMNLNDRKPVVFRLLDNTGKLLFTKQVEGEKGSNHFTLKEGNILSGTYYLQAVGVDGVKQLRIEN